MDTGFSQPLPEPVGGDFLDMAENEVEQLHPGPLYRMLESIEDSIVQPVPPVGLPDDPLNVMLDLVEQSIEKQRPSATELPEGLQDNDLWETLDALEKATENQVVKKEEPVEALPSVSDEGYGSFRRGYVPLFIEGRFAREYPYPKPRMRSSNTGIHCNGGGMTYCHLRETWVTEDECDGCNAFEPADDVSGDDEHCRYAF